MIDKDCYSFGVNESFSSPPPAANQNRDNQQNRYTTGYNYTGVNGGTALRYAPMATAYTQYYRSALTPHTNPSWASRFWAGVATGPETLATKLVGKNGVDVDLTWKQARADYLNTHGFNPNLGAMKPGDRVSHIVDGANGPRLDWGRVVDKVTDNKSATTDTKPLSPSTAADTNAIKTVDIPNSTSNKSLILDQYGKQYDLPNNAEVKEIAKNADIPTTAPDRVLVDSAGNVIEDPKFSKYFKSVGSTTAGKLAKYGTAAIVGNALTRLLPHYDSLTDEEKARAERVGAVGGMVTAKVLSPVAKRMTQAGLLGKASRGIANTAAKIGSSAVGKVLGKGLGFAGGALSIYDTFTKPEEYWDTKATGKAGKAIRTALDVVSTGAAFIPGAGTLVSLGAGGLNLLGQAFNLWSSDNDQVDSYMSGEHITYSRFDEILDDTIDPYTNFSIGSRIAQYKQARHYKNVSKSMDKIIKSSINRLNDLNKGYEDENSSVETLQNMISKAKSSSDSARQIASGTKTLGKNYRSLLSIIRKSGDPNGDRKDKLLTAGISLGMTRQGILNDYNDAIGKVRSTSNSTNIEPNPIPDMASDDY